MTLGLIVLIGVTAVFDPAEAREAVDQGAGDKGDPAKGDDGSAKPIPSAPELERAHQLEAQGKLEEAYLSLPADKAGDVVKSHRNALLKILASKRAADAYKKMDRPERARQTFEAARPKDSDLDPVRDAPLFEVLARLRDEYDRAAVGPAERLAHATLEKAEALRRMGNYTKAAEAYRDVAKANATPGATSAPLPDELVQKAIIGAIESERDDAKSKDLSTWLGAYAQARAVFVEVVTALSTALRYVFYFAVAMGLFIFLARVPDLRRARREVVVDLKDLVSSAGGQAGSQPLGGPDRALTNDFMLAVQSLARDSDGLGEVILSRDTDSQSFAELRVIDNSLAQEFGQAITGTDPVKLGPVSFTPRELFEMLRRAFEQPPALTLTGSLSRPPSDGAAGASDGRVSLCVVGVVRGRRSAGEDPPFPNISEWPPNPSRWDATLSGPSARDRVLREVAANFVFHTTRRSVTLDWPSFRDYHEAMYLNRTEDPVAPAPPGVPAQPAGNAPDPARERMIRAATLLQSSVRHDPTNWLAAFFFGDVLRRLGRNATAARVFQGLGGRIRQARHLAGPATGPEDEPLWRLRAFLDRKECGDFDAVVAYNEAVSWSKTKDRVKNLKAIDNLGRLVASFQDLSSLAPTLKDILSLSRDFSTVAVAESLERPDLWPTGGPRLAMFGLSALASALVVEYEALRYERGGRRAVGKKAGHAGEKPGKSKARARKARKMATKAGAKAPEGAPKDAETAEVAPSVVGHLVRKNSDGQVDRLQERQEIVFGAIVAIDRELETYDNKPSIDRATFNMARGLARNALGRAYYIARQHASAYDALTDATELLPDFAEAYINLASVCLVDRGGKPGWVLEAQEYLTTALRLNPTDSKANYLMGKLCVRLGLDRLAEAEKYLLAAGRDVWTDLEIARLYADHLDPPNLKKAIRRLQSSLSLFPTPDYRPIAFLEYVTRLAPNDRADEWFKRSLCDTVGGIRPEKLDAKSLGNLARTLLAKVTQLLGCPEPPAKQGDGQQESSDEQGEAVSDVAESDAIKRDGQADASAAGSDDARFEAAGSA